MELGEHKQDEPPVPDCDCRRCAVATRDDLRKDAERYRWLVSQTWAQIAMDFRLSVRQRSHDDVDSYGDAIDAAMNGAND